MNRVSALLSTALVAASVGAGAGVQFAPRAAYQVRYSPSGGCTALAVEAVEQARETVLVQGYGFTSAPIAAALVAAQQRGVRVSVILDSSNETAKDSRAGACAAAGISVLTDAKHAIAHNKVIVIDRKTVLTGSFNWTAAAEYANAENLLRVDDARLAGSYADNWHAHALHSTPWKGSK